MPLGMFGNMKLDKQLYRNYNELYSLILQCYKDISILKCFEEMQSKQNDLFEAVKDVSNHFIILAQKDLALTIWKLKFDRDANANTVSRFRNEINKVLRQRDVDFTPIKKGKTDNVFEKKLLLMRNQFLAHTDMTRNSSRIEIIELKNVLDNIRNEFNDVCNKVNDENIVPVSEIQVGMVDMSFTLEFLTLFNSENK